MCFHKDTWRNVEKHLAAPISQTLRGPSGDAGAVLGDWRGLLVDEAAQASR